MRYQIKLIREDVPVATRKKSEIMLKDLLSVMPTLKKYKIDGEIHSKVRKLRDGRKQKHYTLELSRKFITYDVEQGKLVKELRVSAPLTKEEVLVDGKKKRVDVKKVDVLSRLKADIIGQIQALRKQQLPVIENYRYPEGIEVPKLAEVYLKPNTFALLADKRVRRNMTRAKSPKTDDRYVGIELEFACQEGRETVCDYLFEAGVGRYLCVKGDSSIKTDDDYPHGHEINILAKEHEVADVITKVCKVLNERLNVKVDKSCGLHVHLDMRKRNPAHSFANLITMQHFLYAMCPANRKSSKYSIPVKNKEWKPNNEHYDGVSSSAYAKYKTIELRMHCGTTQASKVKGWVEFLIAIADAPAITKAPPSVKAAQEMLNLSDSTVNYVESRIAKFASQHKKIEKSNPEWMEKVEAVATMPDTLNTDEQSEVA